MRRSRMLVFSMALTLGACLPKLPEDEDVRLEGVEPGDCSDAADNDADGMFDCNDEGCASAPNCVVPPGPPEGLIVAITPDTPNDQDDLHCVIHTEAVDPNGDAITYSRAWTVDGESAGIELETIPAGLTNAGDVWTCTMSASDGTLTGEPVSATVTIQRTNEPPTAPGAAIHPTAPGDDDVLTCTVQTESVDVDGDTITYAYHWSVDGDDAGVRDATVPATLTNVGETWSCSITATDGIATGAAGTASVTILAGCGNGSSTECAAESCSTLGAMSATATTGNYWLLDANGDAYLGYCDMTRAGGGWTHAASFDGSDADNWTSESVWTSTTGMGTSGTSRDYKGPAWQSTAQDLMLVSVDGTFAVFEECFSTESLTSIYTRPWISNSSAYSCATTSPLLGCSPTLAFKIWDETEGDVHGQGMLGCDGDLRDATGGRIGALTGAYSRHDVGPYPGNLYDHAPLMLFVR